MCVFLRRPRSRPCGYFHANTRGNRTTAKSDRSKAALSLEIGLLSLSMFDSNEMEPHPLSLGIGLLSLSLFDSNKMGPYPLSLEIGLLSSLSMFDNNEMGPCPLSLEISLLSLSTTIGPL